MRKTIEVEGVTLHLAKEFGSPAEWIGTQLPVKQLTAAWMTLGEQDQAMNPRIVGKPGVGKTTLAVSVARMLGAQVFLLQGTSDTRPEDLIINPVIAENKQIIYVASQLVTAMLTGGICILDEGNRMSEKSWASLAPLLDHRRYVDSILAGIRISAHKDFRFVTTMNDDASVYDLPEYIQSRLTPQIVLDFADPEDERNIIRNAVPYVEDDLLHRLVMFLDVAHRANASWSARDGIQVAKYASRLRKGDQTLSFGKALRLSIDAVLGEEASAAYQAFDTANEGGPRLRPV